MGVLCLRNVVHTAHQVTRHNTPIHNILSTAPQLSISQKALETLPEDGNVMPKHTVVSLYNSTHIVVPLYSSTHIVVPLYSNTHIVVPLYNSTHIVVPLYSSTHIVVPLYNSTHTVVPLY